MKVLSKFVIPLVVFTLLVTGCSFGGKNEQKENEQSTLKIMYYDEGSFFQEYGMVFSALYPNIEIQVVENRKMYQSENKDMDAALEKFITEEQPDILMLDTDQYKKLALDGKLYDLDPVMEKEKYNTEGLIPGMLDYLRENGGGQVFGMTPSFYSQVMFYNKDLFEKYQIEPPTNRMSWDQTIQLARRFPTDGDKKERIYGLKMGYSEDLFEMASILANSENVNYVNASQKQMTINTDSWKNAFKQAIDALDSNALYFDSMRNQGGDEPMAQSYEDYLLSDPFIAGRLAMTMGDINFINQIKQAAENEKVKDKIVKNWDIVTVPVGQQNPDQSSMMSFNNIFSIRSESPSKDAAWKFLSYVTSEDFARVKSKSNNYNGLPVRTKYITDTEGHNFAAFYDLKPSTFNSYKDFDKLPQSFWGEFRGAASQELEKVKKKEQELDAALDILQVKGQEMLLKEDPVPTEGAEGAGTSESSGSVTTIETTE